MLAILFAFVAFVGWATSDIFDGLVVFLLVIFFGERLGNLQTILA